MAGNPEVQLLTATGGRSALRILFISPDGPFDARTGSGALRGDLSGVDEKLGVRAVGQQGLTQFPNEWG